MRALAAAELLDIWERGLPETPVQRALLLLRAGCSDAATETLAELSIGRRDSLLLDLRERTFGSQLNSVVACPGCAERVELSFDTADLRAAAESTPQYSLNIAGREISFRLPNSLDLAAIEAGSDVSAARNVLLKRCLFNWDSAESDHLPHDAAAAIAEQMARADPQADVQLAVCCPACRKQWRAAFDVAAFFWSEINIWAQRMLNAVHRLASAYGWSESDILKMSPARRQFYLGAISG